MSIFNKVTKTFQWGQQTVTMETGEIARQSGGAVVVSIEDTVVLATVVAKKDAKPGQDFFPLTVDYIEKTYAAGKIPGSFFKREGPSERARDADLAPDRPAAPAALPEGFYNEVQVVIHVLSLNPEIAADIPSLIGASAALAISGIPFNGPIGAARVGYIGGQYVLNPTKAQMAETQMDLIVAGTQAAVLMVESEAKQLTEEVMLGGVVFGHEQGNVAIAAINELVRDAGKPMWDWQPPAKDEAFISQVGALAEQRLRDAYQIRSKQARTQATRDVTTATVAALSEGGAAVDKVKVDNILFDIEAKIVRSQILSGEPRIDGRDTPHRAADRDPHGSPAACPRLCALHARRDAGAGRGDARHRPRLAAHRRTRRRVQRALHAPLQHAPVRDRRDRPRRLAEAARDRSRAAGQARPRRRPARPHRVPVLDAHRLRDHRVERARRRWRRCAAAAWR
jgi:polyribonucleotide nucleotidyltransferase